MCVLQKGGYCSSYPHGWLAVKEIHQVDQETPDTILLFISMYLLSLSGKFIVPIMGYTINFSDD